MDSEVNMVEAFMKDLTEKASILNELARRKGIKGEKVDFSEPDEYSAKEIQTRRDLIDSFYFYLMRDRKKVAQRMSVMSTFNLVGKIAFSAKLPADITMRAKALYTWHFNYLCSGMEIDDETVRIINTLNEIHDINLNPYVIKLKKKLGKSDVILRTYQDVHELSA